MIGGGHNGLTAAAYLARAGLSTLVLERREIVGGCCVTEEIAPGCRVSTTSYIASMLRPEVISDCVSPNTDCAWFPAILRSRFPSPMAMSSPGGRTASGRKRNSERFPQRTRETFVQVDDRLKKLARYLQPFFHGAAAGDRYAQHARLD